MSGAGGFQGVAAANAASEGAAASISSFASESVAGIASVVLRGSDCFTALSESRVVLSPTSSNAHGMMEIWILV